MGAFDCLLQTDFLAWFEETLPYHLDELSPDQRRRRRFYVSDRYERWECEVLEPAERQRRIPTLITDLASPDATTRSLAYFHLRLWTGQSFGHAWKGHQSMRPTQKEGREMQPDWTNWWATSDASSR